jgi:hypothetical protein
MRWRVVLLSLLISVAISHGQVQYVPPEGGSADVSGIVDQPGGVAGIDDSGALNDPDARLSEAVKFVTAEPGAGDCDFATQEIRYTAPGGQLYGYICNAVGGNPQRIDEYGDSPVEFATQGTTVVMSGPTSVTLTGTNGISTAGNNTTKTLTVTKVNTPREVVLDEVAAADDNIPMGSFGGAVTITEVWCRCSDTSGTLPTFTLADGAGNALTITGTNPTCTSYSAAKSAAAITAGNTLTDGELLVFNTTNTPTAGKRCIISVSYTYN